jgi:hypothetical protein
MGDTETRWWHGVMNPLHGQLREQTWTLEALEANERRVFGFLTMMLEVMSSKKDLECNVSIFASNKTTFAKACRALNMSCIFSKADDAGTMVIARAFKDRPPTKRNEDSKFEPR